MATYLDELVNKANIAGQQASKQTGVAFTPLKSVASPINAGDLRPTPEMNFTQPKPSTGSVGMSAEIEQNAKTNQDAFTQNVQDKKTTAEEGYNSSLYSYIQGLAGQQGETEMQDQAYTQEVDPIKTELVDINNKINAEVQANRRRIQALQKNPTGMLAGALNSEVDRVNDESLSRQADLSVIQMGIQGRYDSAKEIADRAIAVKLEKQKNLNEALKINYEENKDLFNKAEQRAFETEQGNRDRALAKEEKNLQEISDLSITAIQNGAPASVVAKIRNSETVDEAYGFAGGYGVSLDDKIKRAQLNKLNATDKGEAPTIKSINGVDMQWDGSKWVTPTGGTLPQDINQILELEDKIKSIDGLIKDKGFAQSVGSTGLFGRGGTLQPGQRQNFIAGVQQLVSKDTLETLINLKAKGGTLGALSDQERIMLQSAATKIGFWAKTDKNGKVVSYQANEKDFKAELETIKRLTERAYDKATGGTESYLNTLDSILQETVNPYTQAGYILD